MSNNHPTREEIEFRRAELEAFIKRYGLEDIDRILVWVLTTIKTMISEGKVTKTKEGVMNAMSLIVSAHPEIDQYLNKFEMAADQEMLNELKQTVRPN